jgi:hypothetical protein
VRKALKKQWQRRERIREKVGSVVTKMKVELLAGING